MFGLFIWQFAIFVLTIEEEIEKEEAALTDAKILHTIPEEIGEVKVDAFGVIPSAQMLSIYKVTSKAGQTQFQDIKKKLL